MLINLKEQECCNHAQFKHWLKINQNNSNLHSSTSLKLCNHKYFILCVIITNLQVCGYSNFNYLHHNNDDLLNQQVYECDHHGYS